MTNTPRMRRAANICALRRAILRNQEAPVEGRSAELRAELNRLEAAEVEDYQGVSDAPVELLNPQLLA